MIRISTNDLQANLQTYLEQVAQGETVIIEQDKHRELARLVPGQKPDWRDQMTVKLGFNVPPDELIEPLDDIWDDYI